MEEGSGVQAPVTRLRRKLSVEQLEDANSPAPVTPTKKRGGRLAAKPQLELIDENASSASKRSAKMAPVKELSQTAERPVTPSRRSTRIKSNTSIISETSQSVEGYKGSPRAIRAARRTSQTGSDTESVVTPVRATRRTRKDSATSVERLETTLGTKPSNITEIIIEESECNTQKSNESSTTKENVSVRKSPRLKEKEKKKIYGNESNDDIKTEMELMSNNTVNDLNIVNRDSISESAENKSVIADSEYKIPEKVQEESQDTSLDMIKELDKKPKRKSNPNKSMSSLDNNCFKTNRQRSKSLNLLSQLETNDSVFFSDNEKTKKKVKSTTVLKVSEHRFASGDNKLTNNRILNQSKLNNTNKDNFEQQKELNTPINTDSKKTDRKLNEPQSRGSDSLSDTISPRGNNNNINVEDDKDSVISFLKQPLGTVLQTTVIYEDSDTDMKIDTDIKIKVNNKDTDSEDQCVPEVVTKDTCVNSDNISPTRLNKSDKKNKKAETTFNDSSMLNKSKENIAKNTSCEPMDVDVTILNNITSSETLQVNKSFDDCDLKSKVTSYCSQSTSVDTSLNKSSSKTKPKSSVSLSNSQNHDKSDTENKSTLILSQIKDVSSTEKNVTKSPKPYDEHLLNISIMAKNKITDEKNLSVDYSTSTPLQQKHLKKLGLNINTSLIECPSSNNTKTSNPNKSKKEISKSSEMNTLTDEESNTDDGNDASRTKSILDYEADVASDDYESGDSQDEEQRRYEDENEIVDKGETLDSEDDISNDSDYEKDSFVVSSDEEDSELLSGSGDDLSLSNNELTMSAKSKKKYNERKQREQKKASKEMFEARHKLNANANEKDKKTKKITRKLDSTDESDDEIVVQRKNNKHQRLDSTHEDNTDTSDLKDEAVIKKKHKSMSSESNDNENVIEEQEITNVFNNSTTDTDPLSIQVKQEPKTPIKALDTSTVQINEEIEEVAVEKYNSFSKTDQTTDPLQTMMDDNSSSLSENSEIMNNYDSLLNQLHNDNAKSKSIKSLDISLNSGKNTKKTKIPIVEELNLTQTKKSKRNKKTLDVVDSPQISKISDNKAKKDIEFDKDSSSDSIDLHLLFSEDSNDDVVKSLTDKGRGLGEDYIPLKRTTGKMNMLQDQDDAQSNDEIQFVIDTQGTKHNTENSVNMSINNSTKKNSKKNKSLNISQQVSTQDEMSELVDEDAPLEIPYKSSKNEKRKKTLNTSEADQEEAKQHKVMPDVPLAESVKKKKEHSITLEDQADSNVNETSLVCPGSGKKKKKKSESQIESDLNTADTSVVIPGSGKKKKLLSVTNNKLSGENDELNSSQNVTLGSAKKKKDKNTEIMFAVNITEELSPEESLNSKKRKRKSSASLTIENEFGTEHEDAMTVPKTLDTTLSAGRQNKKRKISHNDTCNENTVQEGSSTVDLDGAQKKKNKKRKRGSDDDNKTAKILKENSLDQVHVTRLPTSILNQLDDKPKKSVLNMKKSTVVSTTSFVVEEAQKRKSKPSNFLEETVYINDSHDEKKQKGHLKKPKVLPFMPTVATSGSGFTTNFKINIIPQEVQFVAQTKNVTNFKNDYLYGKRIKRLGTYEKYKKQRSYKISKF